MCGARGSPPRLAAWPFDAPGTLQSMRRWKISTLFAELDAPSSAKGSNSMSGSSHLWNLSTFMPTVGWSLPANGLRHARAHLTPSTFPCRTDVQSILLAPSHMSTVSDLDAMMLWNRDWGSSSAPSPARADAKTAERTGVAAQNVFHADFAILYFRGPRFSPAPAAAPVHSTSPFAAISAGVSKTPIPRSFTLTMARSYDLIDIAMCGSDMEAGSRNRLSASTIRARNPVVPRLSAPITHDARFRGVPHAATVFARTGRSAMATSRSSRSWGGHMALWTTVTHTWSSSASGSDAFRESGWGSYLLRRASRMHLGPMPQRCMSHTEVSWLPRGARNLKVRVWTRPIHASPNSLWQRMTLIISSCGSTSKMPGVMRLP